MDGEEENAVWFLPHEAKLALGWRAEACGLIAILVPGSPPKEDIGCFDKRPILGSATQVSSGPVSPTFVTG